ncbi:MAG: DUF1573 domain-containing protein [Chitinophagia bacterium]|nr:DUF1573 domain-containing protein [Chitinophagia bacterium]
MKRFTILLLLAFIACNSPKKDKKDNSLPASELISNPHTASGLDTVSAARKPTMDFTDTLYEFGTIKEGETVAHQFSFKNNGKTPLFISGAAGSCGCTVPEYPKEPIAPNAAGTIKVTFNSAGKAGAQTKTVTIQANTLKNIHILYIKGNVNTDK